MAPTITIWLASAGCLFALWRGDREVRILTLALGAAFVLSLALPVWRGHPSVNLPRLSLIILVSDLPLLLAALAVCLTTRRLWPFMAASALLAMTASDILEVLSPVSRDAHVLTSWTWIALYISALVVGASRNQSNAFGPR